MKNVQIILLISVIALVVWFFYNRKKTVKQISDVIDDLALNDNDDRVANDLVIARHPFQLGGKCYADKEIMDLVTLYRATPTNYLTGNAAKLAIKQQIQTKCPIAIEVYQL